MIKEDSNENMESVGSHESMNWFIEEQGGDGDMDIGLNITDDQQQQQNNQLSVKKRVNSTRGKSRQQSSESPLSDEAPTRSRNSRKKYVKRKEEPAQAINTTTSFIESMKTSSSRLSRSLSSSKAPAPIVPTQKAEQQQQHLQQQQMAMSQSANVSSGDESGTGHSSRSEAALAAEQKFKDKNREHARNTRSRKKQYIETLKQAFNELSAEVTPCTHLSRRPYLTCL